MTETKKEETKTELVCCVGAIELLSLMGRHPAWPFSNSQGHRGGFWNTELQVSRVSTGWGHPGVGGAAQAPTTCRTAPQETKRCWGMWCGSEKNLMEVRFFTGKGDYTVKRRHQGSQQASVDTEERFKGFLIEVRGGAFGRSCPTSQQLSLCHFNTKSMYKQ